MPYTFISKDFNELTVDELYLLLQLRSAIFIVEQNCAYADLDDKDRASRHILVFDGTRLVGYARVLPKNVSYEDASIGRVAVVNSYRRKGVGILLMQYALNECYAHFDAEKISISAQVYAIPFYKKTGFEPVGETYLEDGIPHIRMTAYKSRQPG